MDKNSISTRFTEKELQKMLYDIIKKKKIISLNELSTLIPLTYNQIRRLMRLNDKIEVNLDNLITMYWIKK